MFNLIFELFELLYIQKLSINNYNKTNFLIIYLIFLILNIVCRTISIFDNKIIIVNFKRAIAFFSIYIFFRLIFFQYDF